MQINEQQKHEFQAEVSQLLHIVVHSLYSNKEIFLRELISNANDACDKLRFATIQDPNLNENDVNYKIQISFDADAKTITISDNGIGMSKEEVIENLGTIAKSGTKEFLAKLTGDQKKDSQLIGQFGVGFYAAFMVADEVTVLTRRAGLKADQAVMWQSKGDGSYLLNQINKATRGTDVILKIKESDIDFLDEWRLRNIITKYSDYLNVPIQMPKLAEDKKPIAHEWEVVNQNKALWTLAKNTLKDSDYIAFYKYIAHDFEDPLCWTHNRIEGANVDYTTLLYIPSQAPFDLWHQEKHYGLKLYVQRVFIMDEVEQFLPRYLRFVKGVIDTNALPLNISREILQDHPILNKLKVAVSRHVLELLEKIAASDPEKYDKCWQAFGNVLKEGPAEDYNNRMRIAKLMRFYSSFHSEKQTVSFADYVQRKRASQTKIYYVTADNIQSALNSPHLEVFKKNQVEVLILTDRIDEWAIGHISEFEGLPLQSVAKGDLALAEIQDENLTASEQETVAKTNFDAVITKMKTILDKAVKEVRISERLTASPVCLVRDQDALGPQMERLLKAAGQPVQEVKPSLELNADHILIKKLQQETNEALFAAWTKILYEQALLAEGSSLEDPAGFVVRLNDLWQQYLSK